MNYNELKTYLINVSNQEFIDLVDKINNLFIKYNIDYLDEISNIVYNNSQDSDEDIVDTIRVTLDSIVTWLLTMHSIKTSEDILLIEKVEICDALFEFENYEDKDSIDKILESDLGNAEKLCEILALLTPYNVEKLLSIISDVDDNLISSLNDKNLLITTEELKTAEQVSKQIRNYSKFKVFIKNKETFADQFFINLTTVGLSFSDYFNLYLQHVKDKDLNSTEEISLDLIGLCLLSNEEQSPINIIREYLSKITQDANISTKIDMYVTKFITELQ